MVFVGSETSEFIEISKTREGWCVGCVCLSRPSGRVGSNDPLSLSSTESTPTSHAKSQRPSNPNRLPMCATEAIGTQIEISIDRPIASQCAPPWPSEPNRFPMCATVAIGTQIETRIDHSVAARRVPTWPWEPRPKAELSNQSLPDVRHRGHRNPDRNQNRSPNRCPTCATVAMGTQFETRIERQSACQLEPKTDTEIDPKSIPKGSK